jgi:hypothetical protein
LAAATFTSLPQKIWYGTGLTTSWDFGAGPVTVDGDGVIAAQSITTFATAVGSACAIQPVAGVGHFGTVTPYPAAALSAFIAQHVTVPGASVSNLIVP